MQSKDMVITMRIGENIQYLRQMRKLSQEKLAEMLSVTRQTISKWEMNQVYPEIPNLIKLSEIFHCKIDDLVKKEIYESQEEYSSVKIKNVDEFRMARYVMITPNPEDDVNTYLERWAENSGLNSFKEEKPKRIGWDFPFVSQELQNRFGLRGYAAAYVLPDGFTPACGGVEIVSQNCAQYAYITIRDPFSRAFELIPGAYKKILEHLGMNGFKQNTSTEFLSCFEYVYEKDKICYMDVYIHIDSVGKANIYTLNN